MMTTHTLIDAIEAEIWVVNKWRIKFILSEKQLHLIRKSSGATDWYENESIKSIWMDKLTDCFQTILEFHQTFGQLPQSGDRLTDEDLGLLIQERSIDGKLKTITYILSI